MSGGGGRRVYILVDGRRGPSEADGQMMETLTKAAITHQVRDMLMHSR